jgi:hypothetical protein
MGLLYDLIADTEAGIATVPIHAESQEQALVAGRELFPGCRLALVLRDGEPGNEAE